MFSPSMSQSQPPVRTSRRKRPDSQSISGQPSSKRQRNALTEQTFVPLENFDAQENQDTLKKAALANLASARDAPIPQREIAVRGKKSRSGDRGVKGDGSIVLVCPLSVLYPVRTHLIYARQQMIHIPSASFPLYQIVFAQM